MSRDAISDMLSLIRAIIELEELVTCPSVTFYTEMHERNPSGMR
jgi:hypothetical protein